MLNVNAHLHTPYSFSAFDSVAQALDMAVEQGVGVVGINDFYTADGYGEWNTGCLVRGLYPIFGIEMISLDESFQREGVRVNDPANPGRIYISGKGLAFPSCLPEHYAGLLAAVGEESNAHVSAMCTKLNTVLTETGAGFSLDSGEIMRTLTKGNLRERHLAKALRMAVEAKTTPPLRGTPPQEGKRASEMRGSSTEHRLSPNAAEVSREIDNYPLAKTLLEKIFGGKALKSSLQDVAGVENEIRANLLKAGGAAFVAENPRAFLPPEDVIAIIEAAGGIPTYPFLADDTGGNFTRFEGDLPKAAAVLKRKGIHSVEFITPRNSAEVLERYAGWLWDEGFVVTSGSEHNTPAMEAVLLHTRDGAPLTERMRELNYKGACVVAAHQDIYARTGHPYDPARRDEYAALGDKLIKSRVNG